MLETFISKLFKNSESKPFHVTSEFWVFVGAEVTILAEIIPTHNTELKAILAIITASAYKLSRGLSKAGVKPET